MSIVKSSKGNDQLLFEGFHYRRANKSQVTWRCVLNRCAGCLNFNSNTYVILTNHSHAPNPNALISIELKSKVSENAVISNVAPRKIIHEALLSVHPDDASGIDNYSALQRTIERKRKNKNIPLPTPASFEDIKIPEELQITNTGDRFILYDNGDILKRIVILSSKKDLNRLSSCEHWHADGTFKVSFIFFFYIE